MEIGKFKVTQYKKSVERASRDTQRSFQHSLGARQDGGRRQDPSTKQRHAGETLRAKDYNVLKTRNREHELCEKFKQLGMAGTKENEGEETRQRPDDLARAMKSLKHWQWKGCSARRLEKDAEETERKRTMLVPLSRVHCSRN